MPLSGLGIEGRRLRQNFAVLPDARDVIAKIYFAHDARFARAAERFEARRQRRAVGVIGGAHRRGEGVIAPKPAPGARDGFFGLGRVGRQTGAKNKRVGIERRIGFRPQRARSFPAALDRPLRRHFGIVRPLRAHKIVAKHDVLGRLHIARIPAKVALRRRAKTFARRFDFRLDNQRVGERNAGALALHLQTDFAAIARALADFASRAIFDLPQLDLRRRRAQKREIARVLIAENRARFAALGRERTRAKTPARLQFVVGHLIIPAVQFQRRQGRGGGLSDRFGGLSDRVGGRGQRGTDEQGAATKGGAVEGTAKTGNHRN